MKTIPDDTDEYIDEDSDEEEKNEAKEKKILAGGSLFTPNDDLCYELGCCFIVDVGR